MDVQKFLQVTNGRCSTDLLHIIMGDAEFLPVTIGRCSTGLLHITIGGAEISAGGGWTMQHGVTAYNDWMCRNFCR